MKVLDLKKKEDKKIFDTITNLIKKENIKGNIKFSLSEDLKGAIYVDVWAKNIKNVEEAIKKSTKLNEEIDKIFPHKYIIISIHAT